MATNYSSRTTKLQKQVSLPVVADLITRANEDGLATVLRPVARAKVVLNGVAGTLGPAAIDLLHPEHLVIARVTRNPLLIACTGSPTKVVAHSIGVVIGKDLVMSAAIPRVVVVARVVARVAVVPVPGVPAASTRPL